MHNRFKELVNTFLASRSGDFSIRGITNMNDRKVKQMLEDAGIYDDDF